MIRRPAVRVERKDVSIASLQFEAMMICSILVARFRCWRRDRLKVQTVPQDRLACMERGTEPSF
jgi:hypothetical protein